MIGAAVSAVWTLTLGANASHMPPAQARRLPTPILRAAERHGIEVDEDSNVKRPVG